MSRAGDRWIELIETFLRDPIAWSEGNNSKGPDALDEHFDYVKDHPDSLDDEGEEGLVILDG